MTETEKELFDVQIEAIKEAIKLRDESYTIRFEANSESTKVALHAAEKATLKAETAMDKRLDSMNEFRQTLSDQQVTFLTRNEFALQHKSLDDKVENYNKSYEDKFKDLTDRVTLIQGTKQGTVKGLTWIVGAIGLVSTIITIILIFLNSKQ